jgi:hypothetical protein
LWNAFADVIHEANTPTGQRYLLGLSKNISPPSSGLLRLKEEKNPEDGADMLSKTSVLT